MSYKYKTIHFAGYAVGCRDGKVSVIRSGVPHHEMDLAFAEKILETMTQLSKAKTEEEAKLVPKLEGKAGGYSGEHAEVFGYGHNAQMTYGCRNLSVDDAQIVVDSLRTLNAAPEWKPAEGVVEINGDSGYYLRAVDGLIYTCTSEGVLGGQVMTVEQGDKILEVMEVRRAVAIPNNPVPSVPIQGFGKETKVVYGCQTLDTDQLKSLMEKLKAPVANPAPVNPTPSPSGCI